MKRSKIIEIIIDNICHDPSAYNPKWRWNAFSKNIKAEYQKILPILKYWEEKNYISIINDDEYIFMLFPENLPARDVLFLESLSYENKSNNR